MGAYHQAECSPIASYRTVVRQTTGSSAATKQTRKANITTPPTPSAEKSHDGLSGRWRQLKEQGSNAIKADDRINGDEQAIDTVDKIEASKVDACTQSGLCIQARFIELFGTKAKVSRLWIGVDEVCDTMGSHT